MCDSVHMDTTPVRPYPVGRSRTSLARCPGLIYIYFASSRGKVLSCQLLAAKWQLATVCLGPCPLPCGSIGERLNEAYRKGRDLTEFKLQQAGRHQNLYFRSASRYPHNGLRLAKMMDTCKYYEHYCIGMLNCQSIHAVL